MDEVATLWAMFAAREVGRAAERLAGEYGPGRWLEAAAALTVLRRRLEAARVTVVPGDEAAALGVDRPGGYRVRCRAFRPDEVLVTLANLRRMAGFVG